MIPNAPARQTLWQVCSAEPQRCRRQVALHLHPGSGVSWRPRGNSRSIPFDIWDAVWAVWSERNKKTQIWFGRSHWLKVVLKQGSSGLVLGKHWRCILPNDCLNFKYQVFIQQSSHTVGPWFIWLGYLPERNNLTSSNSCDFSASLIKTPIFRYFVSSHTPHPH